MGMFDERSRDDQAHDLLMALMEVGFSEAREQEVEKAKEREAARVGADKAGKGMFTRNLAAGLQRGSSPQMQGRRIPEMPGGGAMGGMEMSM